MKYCESCKVTIENDLNACPLCGSGLVRQDDAFELDYPAVPVEDRKRFHTKLLIYCTVVLVAASVIIDMLTANPAHWSYLAAGGLIYAALSIHFIRRSRRNLGLLAVIQIFGISTLSFLADAATGYYKWSLNYVIPFVVISAAALMTAVLLARPKRFRDYILYQLGISLAGVGFSVYIILNPETVMWTGIVGGAYSALTILGILIFSARKTRHELHKRFHF